MTDNRRTVRVIVILVTTVMLGLPLSAHSVTRELHWVGCSISKLGFMKDLAKAYEAKTGVRILLDGGGATKGLRDVSAGHSDIGGSCRLPLIFRNSDGSYSVEESEKHIKVVPVGWDALVVIVNKNNKLIDSITLDQLRDVLTGKITHWKQLGAKTDKPIDLYARVGKISGVGRTLRQQLFNNSEEEFSRKGTYLATSGKVEEAVAKDPFGIAVSGISSSRHQPVRMLKLNNVEPTMETLKAGKYYLYRLLFLVIPENYMKDPDILGLVRFAHSVEGQKVIKSAGTLPYHQGVSLIYTSTSANYLNSLEVLDAYKIYMLPKKVTE